MKALDKPAKLQKFNIQNECITKVELFFDNGLGSASYEVTNHSSGLKKYEKTWDTSRQIKKVSVKSDGVYVYGIQFLDENDSEIVKWNEDSRGTWTAKEIPDGF